LFPLLCLLMCRMRQARTITSLAAWLLPQLFADMPEATQQALKEDAEDPRGPVHTAINAAINHFTAPTLACLTATMGGSLLLSRHCCCCRLRGPWLRRPAQRMSLRVAGAACAHACPPRVFVSSHACPSCVCLHM
jgi:hypothetical protein